MKVGLIGAGIIGYGVGLNLLKAEHELVVVAHRNRAHGDRMLSELLNPEVQGKR